ncbi:hypothetical protein F8A86_05330 [Betaproteobacteria bacterium SCN1]|jgi:5-methylcytosine-specific restriction endonuclease McrA|nr:hypothetical protein F8A86_05330 [Betaproteobacteria bacterium SCN1]
MKQCKRCGEQKPLEAFSKRKASKDGLHYYCRECNSPLLKAYSEANRERKAAYDKAYYEANRELALIRARASYEANYAANRPRDRARVRARQAGLATATPMWLSKGHREAIAAIYAEAERLTRETGIPHHVDHIIPLKGKGVCGLHVPWNLRAIPAAENLSKSNRIPDHLIV